MNKKNYYHQYMKKWWTKQNLIQRFIALYIELKLVASQPGKEYGENEVDFRGVDWYYEFGQYVNECSSFIPCITAGRRRHIAIQNRRRP